MNDADAIAALVRDLHWQIDQMRPRGINDRAGNPYNPSYYKRGLQSAIDRGGLTVADYVRGYLYKPPSDGYQKLEDADSLDLACEALIADPDKPYAYLFSADDRALARARLAPHIKAIERRKAAMRARIASRRSELPASLDELKTLAAATADPEEAIAINTAILEQAAGDVVALIRLGRAYEAIGSIDRAKGAFRQALEVDPGNAIAVRRLRELDRRAV
jgi:tetratricopeptide (TPR) repeat protein